MDGIIEFININYDKAQLQRVYEETLAYSPRDYIECGARSWVLSENKEYARLWEVILSIHKRVHGDFCPLATGFNFNETNDHTVPPHIDIDRENYYNLLIPVFGSARIDIFETKDEELEFRHGKSHWKMLKKEYSPKKIGSLLVDKPVLLNTDWLHSVEPEDSPRCVWCTRWVGVPKSLDFKKFKTYVEEVLNA